VSGAAGFTRLGVAGGSLATAAQATLYATPAGFPAPRQRWLLLELGTPSIGLSTEVREKGWFIDSHSLPPKKDFTEKQARLPPLPKSTMIAHCSKRGKQSRSLSVQKTQMDLSYKMLDTAIYNDNKLKVRRKRFPAVPFVEASVEKLCTAKRNVSFSGCLSNSPTS